MKAPPLSRAPWLTVFGAAALALPASAQTAKFISTGDALPGLGTVTSVREFDVNAAGDWIASVKTDQMIGFSDFALVRNGLVVLKPGDVVPDYPAGVGFSSATRLALDAAGTFGWTAQAPTSSYGVYRELTPYLVIGDPIVGSGVAPGVVCTGVFDHIVEPSGTLLVRALMTGSDLPGFHDRVIARVSPHGSGLSATSVLKSGDVLPGHASAVFRFSSAPHSIASNATGRVLHAPEFLDGAEGIYLDTAQLALTGKPSPIFGAAWSVLTERPVALNDAGDYAFSGRIVAAADANELLVWNGIVVAREGDVLPAIAPHAITTVSGTSMGFGAPIRLTQDGRVLWYATWNDPDTTRDSGLFFDHELIVQEGVTHVGGVPIDEFAGGFGQAAFDISADGTEIYLRALLANGAVSAFVLHPAGSVTAIPGCVPNAGSLEADEAPKLGLNASVIMDGAQSADALPFLFLSTKKAAGPAPCGLAIPGIGEVLIDVVAPNPIAVFKGFHFGLPEILPSFVLLGTVPDAPELFGKTIYAQGMWLDLTPAGPADAVRLTNSLALSIGQ